MKSHIITLILLLLIVSSCGRTLERFGGDPQNAVQTLALLPAVVEESSGLVFYNSAFWTNNDSGGKPIIYKISEDSRQLLHQVYISNAKAVDWETLAVDDEYLYIGDTGNNRGNRRDLSIYRVPLDQLERDSSIAEKISLTYEDQVTFEDAAYRHNFDCEAMIITGDSIMLFSKNHKDKRSKVYFLPKHPGEYIAIRATDFDTNGLITGAAITKDGSTIGLLGYHFNWLLNRFSSFVILLWDFDSGKPFSGEISKLNIDVHLQTEGITFGPGGDLYFTSEREHADDGFLFVLPLNDLLVLLEAPQRQ